MKHDGHLSVTSEGRLYYAGSQKISFNSGIPLNTGDGVVVWNEIQDLISTSDVYSDVTLTDEIANSNYPNINFEYDGKEPISNPFWDYENLHTGTRSIDIGANPDLSALVGKTYEDVISENPSQQNPMVPPIPFPDSWFGKWKDIVNDSGTWQGEGIDGSTGTAIDSPPLDIPGTWQGKWSWTADGQLVFDGSFSGSDGTTWQGTYTHTGIGVQNPVLNPPLTPDLTGITGWLSSISSWLTSLFAFPTDFSLNLDPLKNLPIATKFPFCLPFDLKNSIESLQSPVVVPVFTTTWNLPFYQGDIEINLAAMERFAQITRWGTLIVFNLGLILVTRKVLS
ncbi:hypothetical protein CACET_5p00050 (plasmid) [Clostridium aceticum]|uniref:Uncharacterized protein n=1 Tax=Clostridium aceticum TaxID=84022 RepID=A0A0D8I6B5_9CLOT|nr:hypothetical protein [Clostridium aceticum]AKL97378.1 hypothetical protein CACET_5p00050 [Clostridium aceticum]KJF25599.1 hypothetical protein TZ02_17745 [Clostridium aceticum]